LGSLQALTELTIILFFVVSIVFIILIGYIYDTTFSFRIYYTVKVLYHILTELFPIDFTHIMDAVFFIGFFKGFETIATSSGKLIRCNHIFIFWDNFFIFIAYFNFHFNDAIAYFFSAVILKLHS